MRAKKDRLLPASKLPIVFSNKRVREITARLRPPLDEGQVRRFAASLRKAARVYLRAKRAQKDDISGEIKALLPRGRSAPIQKGGQACAGPIKADARLPEQARSADRAEVTKAQFLPRSRQAAIGVRDGSAPM